MKSLRERFQVEPCVVTIGPSTDNQVGIEIIEQQMKVAAFNALSDAAAPAGDHVIEATGIARQARQQAAAWRLIDAPGPGSPALNPRRGARRYWLAWPANCSAGSPADPIGAGRHQRPTAVARRAGGRAFGHLATVYAQETFKSQAQRSRPSSSAEESTASFPGRPGNRRRSPHSIDAAAGQNPRLPAKNRNVH